MAWLRLVLSGFAGGSARAAEQQRDTARGPNIGVHMSAERNEASEYPASSFQSVEEKPKVRLCT